MEGRSSKYYSDNYNSNNFTASRSSRNSRLYKEVYGKYGELDNLPIEDNANEIDIDRLKELVSNNTSKQTTPPAGYHLDILETKKRNIDEAKVHDINKLLERAKYENNKLKEPEDKIISSRRDILSTLESTELSVSDIRDACRKYEEHIPVDNFSEDKQKDDNDSQKDLTMTREMKYQTRQISVDPLIEQVIPEDAKDLSLDLLSDLKPTENTIVTEPIKEEDTVKESHVSKSFHKDSKQLEEPFFKLKEDTSDIDVIKKDENIDTDFFTSSYQFSKRDFSDDEDFFEDTKTHNILKILLLILAILVFTGVIFYFVLNYGIGA